MTLIMPSPLRCQICAPKQTSQDLWAIFTYPQRTNFAGPSRCLGVRRGKAGAYFLLMAWMSWLGSECALRFS